MKKYIINCLFFCVITVLFVGCTKYKNDPNISLKSAYSRIWGTWHVESFQLDGVEIIDSFYSNPKLFNSSDVTFFHPDNFHQHFYANYEDKYNEFTLDKKNIYWNCQYLPSYGISPSESKTKKFLILKLYKEQFWVNTNYRGIDYLIKMKKVK